MIWIIVLALAVIFLILYLLPFLYKGVPFEPTPWDCARRMLELAKVGANDLVYDLGCGTGRILIEATRRFKAKAVGVEINPLLYIWSLLRVRLAGVSDRAEVKFGDFFKEDLSKATVVTVFQSAGANLNLRGKLQRELKPGTKVVTYHWPFNGWDASEMDQYRRIFLYEIGSNEKSRAQSTDKKITKNWKSP